MRYTREEFIALCKEHKACESELKKGIAAKTDAEFWGVALANYVWCMSRDILTMADVLKLIPVADVNVKNNYGLASLHLAAINDDMEVAKMLLERDANVNVQSNAGNTPLHWAARNGHTEVAELLKQYGAKE